jgi:hypothetical protein
MNNIHTTAFPHVSEGWRSFCANSQKRVEYNAALLNMISADFHAKPLGRKEILN